jgi:two-component system, OmpR family, alkaline phosphatase synthesis response regulator PhoP
MAGKKILVVDDEPQITELLNSYLAKEGYSVTDAADGEAALEAFRREQPDLILLDLMLPKLNGYEVCREIRSQSRIPIIMLTARDEEPDKIVGLELGADDYITKPFSPREVVARVRAVLRRSEAGEPEDKIIRAGDIEIDQVRHEVKKNGEVIELTPTEFKLLAVLADSPRRVFTRLQLVEEVQGYSFEGYERTIDAHIKNLRQKVEDDPKNPVMIGTVYGVGYRFEAESE